MQVSVRFPGIDEHGLFIGQRDDAVADEELRVVPLDLQQDMAVRMRVPDEAPVHVEERHAAESAMSDLKSLGHLHYLAWSAGGS